MAFVVNFKASAAISAGPWEIEIGPNKQNDVILIFVQDRDSGSTLAISGYTALDSARSGYAYQSRWFAKVVGATPETNPSLTTGGRPSAHKGAIAYVIRGADISGTVAQIFPQINYVYAGAAARTVSSPAITTTSANNLLIHCAFFDAACVMPDFTAVNATVMTKSSNSKACSAVGFQAAAGAIPTFNWTAARADIQGSSWVLAVKNAAGGDAPLRMVEGRAMLAMLSGFSTLTTSVPNSVSSTINGIDCTSAASTFPALSQPPTWQWAVDAISITGTENFATPASKWCGAYIAIAATNIVGKIVVVPWGTMSANDSARVGPAGAIVVFADASNNYVAYQLKKQTELLTYMYDQLVIKPGTTTPYAGSTAGLGDIVKIGFLYQRNSGQTASVGFYYQLPVIENAPCKMIGGGPNNPITVAAETDFIYGGGYFHGECSFQGSGQLVNRMGLQIGDGATATYLKHTAQSYDVPSPLELPWKVGAGAVPFIIKTSANDVIDLSSAVITSSTLQPFTVDASSSLSASLLTVGLSVIGRTFSDLAGFDWVSASWVECDTVAFKDGDVTNCSISKTVSTGAACSFSASGASVSGTTIDVAGTSAAYHLELGTAVTAITLADVTFTGTPGTDKVHVLATTGTVTITISGTTSLVAGDVTSAGATVVIAAPSVDITFAGLVAGMQVKAFTTGTQTELFSTTNSGTSEVWTGASGTFDYTILKDGYLPIRGVGEVISGSRTITVYPAIDRAFITPSGLTFGTNLFYAPATKLAGLTVASTLQNLYSKLIQSFRTEATLQNKQFPMSANGPSSFSWLDGNTFDLTTYPNSISLLSRDGMQYLDTNGAATDVWAAVLSVGVPPTFQVRYQQQDGLGTTNAQNTGNIDQLIKIKKTGTGAFDYTGWLVLKVQHAGYDQAEAVAQDIYGTLEDQLYVFGLTPIPNGIAAGSTDATVTVTPESTPVLWNGSYFSTTIKDTTDTHTGLQIMQAVRAENQFNWSDLVRPNGDKFKTVTGNFYGDAYLTPAGVRVVKSDGVTPHPDFNLFNDDSGSNPYTPPVTAPITWAGALNGTTVLLYNDSNAGALIDTQSVSGAGGYVWFITLPHADVAVGDSLRLRFGHKEYYAGELQGTMTASGLAFVGPMTLHPIYAAWGLNGSTYDQANGGPFTMDGVNLEIDIGGGAGTGLKKALGAWTQHLMTLPAGLDAFYGAWDLLDLNQIRQNVAIVDVLIDKPSAGQYTFTDNDINYYRSDFSIPYNTTHSPIFMTYNAKPFVATVTGGNVITGDPETVAAAVGARIIDGTLTADQVERITLAALAGKVVKSGTNIKFKSVDGLVDRIDGTVDDQGNRTAVTLIGN